MRILTICLGQEPASLFWYSAISPAAQRVLAAVYDGPFDRLNFNNRPVILEKEPALQEGDVFLEPVAAAPGEWIYDATGERVVLAEGVRYRPLGCSSPACAVVYNGNEAVQLDRVGIRFRLKSGLTWSDGAPLTASDSLYSYEIARALQPEAGLALLQATHSYQALDELTLEWRGLPGYLGGSYAEKFFHPLPRHAWSGLDPQALSTAEISARLPLGWGAYLVESWQPGEAITLRRNPNYFRTAESLPHFDRLVYRFLSADEPILQALQSGKCDWVDPAAISPAQALDLQRDGAVRTMIQPATAWEQLTLAITRWDGTASLLAQAEVRRALAQCIDRGAVARAAAGDLAQAAQGFLPLGHPQAQTPEQALSFDPQAGQQLLMAAGWLDLDGDSATPRTSQGVPGVPEGTALALELLVSPETERQAAALQVQSGLAGCGVGVKIVTQPFEAYLAPGPEGPVFGRSFQLAQFAWPAAGERLCTLYLSREIPGPYPEAPKGWGGGNAGGYASPAFDQACQTVLNSLPDATEKAQALQELQAVFQQDPPAIPLYWRVGLAAARSDLCLPAQAEPSTDPQENPLWNIESFYRSEICPIE
jgi:peptide/nickel transport system substrate-binding protein